MSTSYGSSSAATAPPTLSGYRIVGELGRGGMGVVYRAVQEVLGRQVAIKAMTVDPSVAQQLLERFIQEARIVAHMGSNENIVQVYDVARDQSGSFFIVMEYVEGVSLAQRVRTGPPITLGQTIKLMTSILAGLEHAHIHGVIHRDLKPENIMLTKNGRVKVMDFGIARSDTSSFKTSTGQVMGTPSYMSPEQVRGDRDIDARSDLYSLGIILYFLCVGRLPFADTNPFALGFKHISEPPPPPREVRPEMPPEMEAIILKSLAKDPKDRFQSAGDFIQALNDLVLYHPEFAADQQTPIPMLPTGMPTSRDDGSTNVIDWDRTAEGRTKTAGGTPYRPSTSGATGPARGQTPVAPPATRPAYPGGPGQTPSPETGMPPAAMPHGYGYNPGHTTPGSMQSNMMHPSSMGNMPTGPGGHPQYMMTPQMQQMMMTPTPMPAPRGGFFRSPAFIGALSSILVLAVVGGLFATGVIPGLTPRGPDSAAVTPGPNTGSTSGPTVPAGPGPVVNAGPGPVVPPPIQGGEVIIRDGKHEDAIATAEPTPVLERKPPRNLTPSPAITVTPQPRTTPDPTPDPTPEPTPRLTPRPAPVVTPPPTPQPTPRPKPPVPRIEPSGAGNPIVVVAPFGDVASSPDPTAGRRLAQALAEEVDPDRHQIFLPGSFAMIATDQEIDPVALAMSPTISGSLAREAGADLLVAGTIERGAEIVARVRLVDLTTNKAIATSMISGRDMAALVSQVPTAALALGVGRAPRVVETPAPPPTVIVARDTPAPTPRPKPTPRVGERFRETSEGVVYDKNLDLYWYCPPSGRRYAYNDAKEYCASLSMGGRSGWRLATEEEVESVNRELSEAREFLPDLRVGDSYRYWLHVDTAWLGMAPAFNFDARSSRVKTHKKVVMTEYMVLAVSKD